MRKLFVIVVCCLHLLTLNLPIKGSTIITPITNETEVLKEAQKLGEEYWQSKITKNQDSYFWLIYYKPIKSFSWYQGKGEPVFHAEGTYYPPKKLTEAEKLNGVDPQPIEFEGKIVMKFRVGRLVNCASTFDKCQWADNYYQDRTIKKIKGKWVIYDKGEEISKLFETQKINVPKLADCNQEKNLKSPVFDIKAVPQHKVYFVNASNQPIKLYWLSGDGTRHFNQTIEIDKLRLNLVGNSTTYKDVVWVVTDINDNCLGAYVSNEQDFTIIVN